MKPPTIVEGTLTLRDKQMSLSGLVRPLDADGKPEMPQPRSTVVEGEALGEHVFGKEQKSPLAIKNGPSTRTAAPRLHEDSLLAEVVA